jgi:phosphoribosylaminoimidazole carboxylase PurE protein
MIKPHVAILMGSDSDLPILEETMKMLKVFEVSFECHILSAHRAPEKVADYARTAAEKGIRVIIAAAGAAAHLAGVVAANTTLPVIGIPIDSSALHGMDALLATVQMPKGIPVATVAIGKGGAANAAILAVQILALGDPRLAGQLSNYKKKLVEEITKKDEDLQKKLG